MWRSPSQLAERLLERLAERDADVLGGVVLIDVQIALSLDADIDPRMPGQKIEHVVEKPDPGGDRRRAGAVEIDGDLDVGLLGLARDRALAHCALQFPFGAQWRPFIRADRGPPLRYMFALAAANS